MIKNKFWFALLILLVTLVFSGCKFNYITNDDTRPDDTKVNIPENPSQKSDNKNDSSSSDAQNESVKEELITADQAESAALAHAGLSADEVTRLHSELDFDDGVRKYEVKFEYGGYEYDYNINAVTGEVISFDKDFD